MRATILALLLLLAGSLLQTTPAHADPGNEAAVAALVQRGEALLGKGPRDAATLAKRSMDASRTADVSALLARIAEIEMQGERGDFPLSHASRDRLARLRAELELLPVSLPAVPKTLQSVTGTVTRASDGTPLQNVQVSAFDISWGAVPTSTGGLVAFATTNAAGQYTLTLPTAAYVIRATPTPNVTPTSAGGYRPRVYNGLACDDFNACAQPFGTPVVVSGAPVSGINFALPGGGAISGRVTVAAGGAGVANQFITVIGESEGVRYSTLTDASGNYTVSGIAPGNYRVFASIDPATGPAGVANELHNNRPCGESDCQLLPADPVTVSLGGVVSGIDFALDPLGSVSGTVLDDVGNPIAGASVTAYSADRYTIASASTDAAGAFTIRSLRPGTYRLLASAGTQDPLTFQFQTTHIPGAWPNVSCATGCSPLDAGSPVVVGAAALTLPTPVVLQRGRTLQVTTRAAGSLAAVANTGVLAQGSAGSGRCSTDASGVCTIRGLAPGTYYVVADARGQNYIQTANGGAQCGLTFCTQLGTPVTVPAAGPDPAITIDMATGARISGTITDGLTGRPATRSRVRMELFTPTGELVAQQIQNCTAPTALTPSNCSYDVAGLVPGSYKGVFVSTSTVGWIDTAFGGTPCPRGGCDLAPLPPLFASTLVPLTGINGTLARGALIRGRVTDAATGGPPDCRAFDPAGTGGFQCGGIGFNSTLDNYGGFGQPDRAGVYFSRTGFAPGTTVYASTFLLRNNFSFGWGYIDQAYNGITCPWGSCGITTGTGITVGATDVTGINFPLARGGAISGTVTASAGATPLAAVEVRVFNAVGRQAGRAITTQNGNYTVSGLSPGSYRVLTSNNAGYLDEAWNNIPCEPFCNPLDGSAVNVAGTATTSGVDFSLDLAGSISGAVRLGGVGQANVPVELYGAVGNLIRSIPTTATGAYQFTGLAAGRYFVRTRDTAGRADALYNGQPCVGNACVVRSGTPVDLSAGANLAGIDLAISTAATISGTVRRNPGSTAMSGVTVQLLAPSGAVALSTTTNGSGGFSFTGLAPGDYRLVTRNTPGVVDVAWPGTPCPAACTGLNGSAITVTAGATVGGRDFLLDAGGSISGNVRSGPSAPITGATVQVYNAGGVPVGQISTNASGNYEFNTLPAGNFFVRTQQSLGFADQLFNGRPCTGYCDILSGDPIPVTAGAGTGLVDFVLSGGLSISGRVRDALTSSGVALARVVAFDAGGFIAGQAQANAAGDYTISGLRPGVYRLRTANLSGYVNQVHTGVSCSPTPCALSAGTPVTLVGTPVTGIDFNLVRGSVVSGTATDTFNNPLPTGTAFLYDATGGLLASTSVSNGLWEFNGLANGTYFVLVRNTLGLIDQLYDQVPCPAGACSITTLGTPIVVSGPVAPLAIEGGAGGNNAIDLELPPGQTISGSVRDAANNQPIAGVTVYFFNSAGVEVGQATTNGEGRYTSDGGLAPGSYRAATANGMARGAGAGYVNQLWTGQNCLLACNFASGSAITVATAPTTGIDFNLARAGDGMTGTVRDTQNNPLALITIRVFTAAGVLAGTVQTNSQGFFRINGLPAGNYFARTVNEFGFEDRLFGGGACGAGCNPLTGNPIAVPASGEIGNIDFVLSLPDLMFRNGFEPAN